MDKPGSEFFDDANKFLDIGYSWSGVYSSSAPETASRVEPAQCRVCGGDRKICGCLTEAEEALNQERLADLKKLGITDVSKVRGSNAGAYRPIEDRARELYESGEAVSLAGAMDRALSERENVVHLRPETNQDEDTRPDPEHFTEAEVQRLMHRKGGRGGGGGSGKSRAKSVPVRCNVPECNLQYCDHPKRTKKVGKKSKGPQSRIIHRTGRVSKDADTGLKKSGLNTGEALEILGIALLTGRPFEEVRLNHQPVTSAA